MTTRLDEHPDFSLVLGGPLFQLFRRTGLSGDGLELVRRRVIISALVAWVPLFVLSLIGGHALATDTVKIPFLYDFAANIRFLVALPILIGSEIVVHNRIRVTVKQFVDRRIILPEDLPKFYGAIDSAARLRNSVLVEIGLLALSYTVGLWFWRSQVASAAASWYAAPDASRLHLTIAGYWYAFISLPIFQFILVRWFFRFFLWFQFLWRVSRLNLRLIATHPDRAAGLGFLGPSTYAFSPILFAEGVLLAGVIANRIFHDGQSLVAMRMEIAAYVAVFVLFVLSPLIVFVFPLARAKRQGLRDYGRLASRYVHEFDEKWSRGGASSEEEFLGSGDIQSLADLGNSFSVVQDTRLLPFGYKDVIRLGVATVAPLVPLTLTIFSLEELVSRLIKILF